MYHWEYEVDYELLRCDAFCGIKNTVTGKVRFMFIEMDIYESGNAFDKVAKYNALYTTDKYLGYWWNEVAEKFPEVLVVTTGDPERIYRKVEKENVANLAFRVLVLDRVKKECDR